MELSQQSTHVYSEAIHGRLHSAIAKGHDVVIWNFGAIHTHKSALMGLCADTHTSVVTHVCTNIFELIDQCGREDASFGCVRACVSFIVVGTLVEQVKDCLSESAPMNYRMRESELRGFYLEGLREVECTCANEMIETIREGAHVSTHSAPEE